MPLPVSPLLVQLRATLELLPVELLRCIEDHVCLRVVFCEPTPANELLYDVCYIDRGLWLRTPTWRYRCERWEILRTPDALLRITHRPTQTHRDRAWPVGLMNAAAVWEDSLFLLFPTELQQLALPELSLVRHLPFKGSNTPDSVYATDVGLVVLLHVPGTTQAHYVQWYPWSSFVGSSREWPAPKAVRLMYTGPHGIVAFRRWILLLVRTGREECELIAVDIASGHVDHESFQHAMGLRMGYLGLDHSRPSMLHVITRDIQYRFQ